MCENRVKGRRKRRAKTYTHLERLDMKETEGEEDIIHEEGGPHTSRLFTRRHAPCSYSYSLRNVSCTNTCDTTRITACSDGDIVTSTMP